VTEPRPRVWPVLVAYVVAFVLMIALSTLVVGVVTVRRCGAQLDCVPKEAMGFALSASGMMALAAVSAGSLLVVALVTARLSKASVGPYLRLRPTRATGAGYVAAVVGTSGLSLVCGSAADLAGARGESVMDKLAEVLQHLGPAQLVLAILAIGVGPGLAEETFFRGLMQPRFAARWGRWPGIAAAAFAFGLMHLDKVQSPLAFLLGLFLGWTAERLDGIRPTVAAHAVNNGIFVAAACFGDNQSPRKATEVAMIAGGVLVWGLSLAVLRSNRAVLPAPAESPALP
jgi:membrane protease YdiL (CAAX protease family)